MSQSEASKRHNTLTRLENESSVNPSRARRRTSSSLTLAKKREIDKERGGREGERNKVIQREREKEQQSDREKEQQSDREKKQQSDREKKQQCGGEKKKREKKKRGKYEMGHAEKNELVLG